jgi:hypothetical protein
MTTDRSRRVRNLASWVGGALLAQVLVLLGLSLTRPDPAYGIFGTLFFAGLFGLGSIFCGLIGYALFASFWRSSATCVISCAAGASSALLMMLAIFATGWVAPDSARLELAASLCAIFGAASYALANHARSNQRLGDIEMSRGNKQ